MEEFHPNLDILPPPQLSLWSRLDETPEHFTLYGGTALALRFGHRTSVDFDFFSNQPFDPDLLARSLSYLKDSERLQMARNTLTCRVDLDGPVLVSFFGNLGLGVVEPPERVAGRRLYVASLLDIAGAKAAVVQKRAEAKDYLDIAALLEHGVTLPQILAAGRVVYGRSFNPVITLKALSYFMDLPDLPSEVAQRLLSAVQAVNLDTIPILKAHSPRAENQGGE